MARGSRAWEVLREALSLEQQVDAVRSAIYSRNDRKAWDDTSRWYPVDVQSDSAIVRQGAVLYRVPYTMDEQLSVNFGEMQRVEVTYAPVPLTEAFDGEAMLVESSSEPATRGLMWDVTIIKPGLSLNGVLYTREVLARAAPLYEGVHVYYFPQSSDGHEDEKRKVQANLAGWIDGVAVRESDGAVTGRLHFLQEGVTPEFRGKLVDAWERGNRRLMGLSHDSRGATKPHVHMGRRVRLCESIAMVLSVDVVHRAAAGGAFERLVASATSEYNRTGGTMTRRDRLALVLAKRTGGVAGVDVVTAELEVLMEAATDAELQEAFGATAAAHGAPAPAAAAQPNAAELALSRIILRERLQESQLPPAVVKHLQEELQGEVLTEAEIDDRITKERAYLAAINPTRFHGAGPASGNGTGVQVGPGKLERLQAAFDRMMGLPVEDPALRSVAPITIRPLYDEITGGHDRGITGRLTESVVSELLQEGFTTATLPGLLGNTLNRMLAVHYAKAPRTWDRIASPRPGGVKDLRPVEYIRVGGFTDLPLLSTQAPNFVYPDLGTVNEERSTYSAGTRGGRAIVTRDMILNDDVSLIARFPVLLGESASRTLDKTVWLSVLSNPQMTYDGYTLFEAIEHGNVITTGLGQAALEALDEIFFTQEELTSGEPMAAQVTMLAVGIKQKAAARRLNQSGTQDNDNPFQFRFGEKAENILVVPWLTDPNDYVAFGDVTRAPVVEVSFLNDQREPEFFMSDNPNAGSTFLSDHYEWKVRHTYGVKAVDHRQVAKGAVPEL